MTNGAPDLKNRFFDIGEKLASVERKINSVFDQLKIVEQDTIEKHRELLKQIDGTKDDMAETERRLAEVNELVERFNAKLGELASKEKVKILEKYINLWDPIKFVTRQEVENLISQVKHKPTKEETVVQKRPRGRPRKNR